MKLPTFIPVDTSSLRIPNVSGVINNGSLVEIEIGYEQPNNEGLSDLFSKFLNSSSDTQHLKSQNLQLEEFSNPGEDLSSFFPGKQVAREAQKQDLVVTSPVEFKLEKYQAYEEIDTLNLESSEAIPSLIPGSYIENKVVINGTSSGNPIPETSNSPLSLLQGKSVNIAERSLANALGDMVTLPTSKATVEGQATSIKQPEIVKIAAQEGVRSVDPLLVVRQATKLDTIAMAPIPPAPPATPASSTTTILKAAIPIVTITQGELASQTPVLPSIVPHEISSFIVRSVTDPVAQNIRTVDAVSQNIANASSTKSIELQLVPRSLGVVEIKIVRNNDQLNIMMRTKTLEAENILRTEISSLQEVIRSAGIMVDDVKVTIQQQSDLSLNQIRQAKSDENSLMQFEQNSENQTSPGHQESKSGSGKFDEKTSTYVTTSKKVEESESRDGLYF